MPRGKSECELLQEWHGIEKNWYSIYQWKSLITISYSEYIATLILEVFPDITLETLGLRRSGYRVGDHRGQANLQTNIEQSTEKRFCRAIFNSHSNLTLGEILDYEVPLKAERGAMHGDIDLVAHNDDGLLLIEAKQPKSKESILKAILQVFTYSMLVSSNKRQFAMEYGIAEQRPLIPAILIFALSKSGKQFRELEHESKIVQLLEKLNTKLSRNGVRPMSFFKITDEACTLERCLKTRVFQGETFVVFAESYSPKIEKLEL